MCDCVVEHRGNNGDDTTRQETWLRLASENRVFECGERQEIQNY